MHHAVLSGRSRYGFEPIPENPIHGTWAAADCAREATRDWLSGTPHYEADYNARRGDAYREAHPLPLRPWVVCGRPMTKGPNALVCGEECRRRRKRAAS